MEEQRIKIPKLVVLSGLPRAGKSTFAHALRDAGYAHICSDNFREGLYGHKGYRLTSDAQEEVVFHGMRETMLHSLGRGLDTVIDATSASEYHRHFFLSTAYDSKYGLSMVPAEKYLVWLRTPPATLEQRAFDSGRTLEGLRLVQSYWTDPVPGEGYALITYDHNTSDPAGEFLKMTSERK